ncbi:MAG: hypothetical protein Q4Q23_07215 [Methanobacteriaceae archaeon]|nr:hypothetical protein [Methanobacteriaceae archaeon]
MMITIQIDKVTQDKLTVIGNKNQTYDDIINQLINEHYTIYDSEKIDPEFEKELDKISEDMENGIYEEYNSVEKLKKDIMS